jgi:hypothetical protein
MLRGLFPEAFTEDKMDTFAMYAIWRHLHELG